MGGVKKGPVKNTSKILQCHQDLVISPPPIPMNQYLTRMMNNQFLFLTKLVGVRTGHVLLFFSKEVDFDPEHGSQYNPTYRIFSGY